MADTKVFVIIFGLCVVRLCSASQIAFEATPTLVREVVDPLTVNCTFQDTNIPHTPSSADDFFMYITKADGTILASVSRDTQAQARQDSDFVKVEGHMSLDQISYLQITWPSVAFNGNQTKYICVVHVQNSAGQETLYNAVVLVTVQRVTYVDLVNYIYNEKRAFVKRENELNNELEKLQQNVSDINAFNSELTTHREYGLRLYCGGSDTFKPSGYGTEMQYVARIHFQKPFAKVPVVMYNMRILEVPENVHYRVFYYTSNINTTGFDMICGTWDGSSILSMSIDWTATVV